mgnify:CR=1 FL=1
MTSFVVDHKGEEVISERHQKDFKKEVYAEGNDEVKSAESFTNIDFDDI